MYKRWVAVLLGSAGLASAAPAKKATLALGTATVTSAVDASAVDASAVAPVIKRSASKLLACYTTALAQAPGLRGTAIATFTIGGRGNVTAAVAIGVSDEVETCIAATIAKLRFARPKLGKPIEVSYPLTYEPGDRGALSWFSTVQGDPSRLDDSEMAGVGGSDGNYGFGRKGPAPGSGGLRVGAGSPGRSTASIDELAVTGAVDEALLRQHVERELPTLRGCYDRERARIPALQGTVTARLTIRPPGRGTSATASGLANKAVEACVARAVQAIELPRPKQGQAVVRLSLTFRPPSAAPATK